MDKDALCFIHVPKTGGTSIRTAMIEAGCRYGPCSQAHPWKPRHESAELAAERFANFEALYSFSVVRNPYDRLVSWYYSTTKVTRPLHERFKDFAEWALSKDISRTPRPIRSQWARLRLRGTLGVKRLLRFEHLAQDWARLAWECGLPTTLPHVLRGKHPPWQECYRDPAVADYVYKLFRVDFERLGYSGSIS